MKKAFFLLFSFFFFSSLFATLTFPELTGRVVDKAQILSSNEIESLTKILKKHEDETSNQIVILTINNLNSHDIAEYGYQIGRHWGIGQKNKNNGVLLIVSMFEKKIRIEVGYGLEGALPDKTAHEIIEYIIKPNFRDGNFYNGIEKATHAIIKAIRGEYKPSDYGVLSISSEIWFFIYFATIFFSMIIRKPIKKYKNDTLLKIVHSTMLSGFAGTFAISFFNSFILSFIAFCITGIIVFFKSKKSSYSSTGTEFWGSSKNASYSGGFSSSSSSNSSGGFSSGGGSFGGGGASGGW